MRSYNGWETREWEREIIGLSTFGGSPAVLIRFVIDTGLARVSRYSPSCRTRRLPVEPVAQSSADQRKGRCGRVSDGVCIRLYSEQDFNDRPRFAQPEIQRSNLADVILRMKAFGLGDIDPHTAKDFFEDLDWGQASEIDGRTSPIKKDGSDIIATVLERWI